MATVFITRTAGTLRTSDKLAELGLVDRGVIIKTIDRTTTPGYTTVGVYTPGQSSTKLRYYKFINSAEVIILKPQMVKPPA